MQRPPDAGRLPVAQPAPAGGATAAAQLLRQQAPGGPGSEHEDDAAQGSTIRDARAAALGLGSFSRQQGSDGLPEIIGHAGLAHDEGRLCQPPEVLKHAVKRELRPGPRL